jgi:leucyl/phenylalanyl-tRNA--protein transferase
VIPLDALHVSRSLRRARGRFEVTVDHAFREVMRACADPSRPAGWIDDAFVDAYTRLHELGWARSVEAWPRDEVGTELAGGVYGVAIGGLFAAESMFHRATDAGKVAVASLVERLVHAGGTLLDVQWCTPHLATLGAIEVPKARYLELVADAVARPQLSLSE